MIDTSSPDPITVNGACHCGAVKFTTTLIQSFASARRCNCSICRMRGAVAVSSTADNFQIIEGTDKLATYRFNTNTAEHHFCKVCGIYTHHKRRSIPDQLGVNVACLEGVSPFDFVEVVVYDGANNHPQDARDGKPHIAGVLRYQPSGDTEAGNPPSQRP